MNLRAVYLLYSGCIDVDFEVTVNFVNWLENTAYPALMT